MKSISKMAKNIKHRQTKKGRENERRRERAAAGVRSTEIWQNNISTYTVIIRRFIQIKVLKTGDKRNIPTTNIECQTARECNSTRLFVARTFKWYIIFYFKRMNNKICVSKMKMRCNQVLRAMRSRFSLLWVIRAEKMTKKLRKHTTLRMMFSFWENCRHKRKRQPKSRLFFFVNISI